MDELSRGKSAFTWSDDEEIIQGISNDGKSQTSKYDKKSKYRKA